MQENRGESEGEYWSSFERWLQPGKRTANEQNKNFEEQAALPFYQNYLYYYRVKIEKEPNRERVEWREFEHTMMHKKTF